MSTSQLTRIDRIRQLLAPPVFKDREKSRTADLLNTISLAILAMSVLGTIMIIAVDFKPSSLVVGAVLVSLELLVQVTMRRGDVRLASLIQSFLLWGTITYLAFSGGGVQAATFGSYVLVVVVAGLLLGSRFGLTFAGLSVATGLLMMYAEAQGILTYAVDPPGSAFITKSAHFVLLAVMIQLAVRSLNEAVEDARHRTQEVQALHESLEERVAERTRELEASQRVTLAASERVSPEELLGQVVDLIRDQFDLYHAQVYIVDEEQNAAVLRESTGYAGSQLLEQGHQIPLDQPALVTRAIHDGEPVLVDDVEEAEDWLPNPLLPETRTELVIPLKSGDQIIGALDVQDRTPGRFSQSTIDLFQSMTDQVALLFENSELFRQATDQSESLTTFSTQLRTAADIAEHLSTILDPDQVLVELVELMQSRFGLYHAHVYVLDEATQTLTVQAGSGEVGRVLTEQAHGISVDAEKSLVARAARERRTIIVEDTTLDSDFMANPLLPQTRSEISVPLIAGERVLGVLDVQDDQPNRFTESERDVFGTLAGQVATAMQNADLFEQTEARLRVSQALAPAQTEDEVLDAMIGVADFYPEAQVTIFIFDETGDERNAVVRRIDAFDSGLAEVLEPGVHFPASAFPLLQLITPHEPFVSANLPEDERADPASREITRQAGAMATAVLPLTAGGEWIGLVSASSKQEGYFDERKLYLYEALTEQGAQALQAARLQAEVRESERQYSELLGSLRDGFAAINLEGKVTNCNAAFERITGYTLEELKEISFTDLTPPKWHEMENKILEEQAMVRGYTDLYQKEYIRKDGRIIPVELAVYVLHDEAGQPSGFWGFIRDITERVEAEQAIRESEERFRLMVSGVQDYAIITLDPEGHVTSWNEGAQRTKGYTEEEILGQHFSVFYPQEDVEAGKTEMELRVARQEGSFEDEGWRLRQDGSRFWANVVITALYDDEGELRGFSKVTRDITEQKQAADEVRQSQQLLQGFLDNFPDLAFAKDREGHITLSNQVLETAFAVEDEESLLGKTVYDLVPEEVAEGIWASEQEVLETGEPIEIEELVPMEDGLHYKLTTKFPLYDAEGNIYGLGGVSTDITEQKRVQEERQRFTTQLSTAADIAAQVSAILDPAELLGTVIPLLKERFDLYHAHYYRLDQAAGELVLTAGYGQPGKQMLEQGHRIPLEREVSLVARAARSQEPVVVHDVTQAPDFMPNPLLPDTKSEVAVPVIAAGQVLGVFDVQHDEVHHFTSGDLSVFQTLAGQIATALENARLYEEAERERALYDSILTNLPVGVWVADREFNVLLTNEYQQNMMGRKIVGAGGSTHVEQYDVIDVETGEAYDESKLPIVRTMSDGQPHVADNMGIRHPDGTVVPVMTTSGPLLDPEGKQIGSVAITSDISERIEAEQAIRESEARFRDVALSTSDWVWEVDAEGRYTYCSEKVVDILGYTAEEVLGKTPFDTMRPDEVERVGQVFGELVANKQPIVDLENWNITKDGQEVCLLTSGVPMLDEDGELLGYRGVDEDITERKRVEEERQRFTTQLSTAADIATQVSTILDPEELLGTVIPLLKERFDLYHAHYYQLDEGAGELVLAAGYGQPGQQMLEQGHHIPLEREVSLVARAARSKEPVVVHDVTAAPDFMPNPLLPDTKSEVAVPVISAGQVLGVFDVQHDEAEHFTSGDLNVFQTLAGQVATALQNARLFAEQQQAEERFRTVADFTYDWETWLGPDEQYLYVSPACERITGYAAQELIDDPGLFVDMVHPEDREMVEVHMHEHASTAETEPIEYRIITKDGQERWIGHACQAVYDAEGEWQGRRGSNRDITVEKRAEAELNRQVSILDNSRDYIGAVDMQGTQIYVNLAGARMLGYDDPAQLIGKGIEDMHLPKDAARVEQEAIPTAMREGAWRGENRVLRQDGTLIPVEQSIFVIRDERGQPEAIATIMSDITERLDAQEEMQKLSTVVTHSSELVNLATLEGQMTFINEAGSRMLGIEADEIGQYAIPHVIPEELMPMVQEELLPTLMTKGAWEGELQYKNVKTGEITDAYASTFLVTDPESGEPLYLANVSRDITEQKQIEVERERFTTQLSTAADIAAQVSAILDPAELLGTVIPLLKERFDLYHAHYYRLDQAAGELVLTAGYGQPGKQMLEQGHRIPLEREVSLVARAARSQEPVVVHDVTQAPDFMPNPLLPDTRSEVAVPVIAAGQVLGVFDVQHDEAEHFTQGDLNVFQTLAGQIATALENADLFAQTQARLRVSQALAAAQTEDEVLDAMVGVADFYPNAQVMLFTFDPNAEEQTLIARRIDAFDSGVPPIIQADMRFPASVFTLVQLISATEPFVSANMGADERVDSATRDLVEQMGVTSSAVLPVTAGNEWLGIVVATAKQEGYFDERKLYLYRALAEQGAQALQSARLRDALSLTQFSVDNAPESIFWIRPDTTLAYVSEGTCRMLGYTREELLEMSVFDVDPVFPREAWDDHWQEIKEKKSFSIETVHQTKDGRRVPVEVVLNYMVYGDQEYDVAFARDITERVEAEQAIRESEERFRLMVSGVQDYAIITLDPEGHVTSWNEGAQRTKGYTEDEILGQHFSVFYPQEDVEAGKTEMELRVARQEGSFEEEGWRLRQDGSRFWANVLITALYDDDGELRGFSKVTRDITERRRAEERVRAERDRAQMYLDMAGTIIVAMDDRGDVTLLNERGFEVLGYAEKEIIGQNWFDLTVPEGIREDVKAVFQNIMAGEIEQAEYYENEITTKGGETRIVAWHNSLLKDERGNIIGALSSGEDITEQKRAEEERQRFTTQLSTAADIATQVSAILDPEELLDTVIPLLKERFDLYHAHYYRLDEGAGELVLTAGYGEPGKQMLEQGHHIPLEREVSLVARAARGKEPVVVHDVTQAPDFMPNPLLPETKSEVAVPVISGGQVLGVFDVQHDEAHHFTQGDLNVFQTLAGQIATALENADLFAQTQARLRVSQALAAAQTEDEVLDALIEVADFYPEAQVTIFTFEEGGEERNAVVRRSAAFDSGLAAVLEPGLRFPASAFPTLQLITSHEPFVSANFPQDERADEASREIVRQAGAVGTAVLPITAGDQWLGLISASSKQEGYFDERKLYLYRALAEQGAQALQFARLREQVQQREELFRGMAESTLDGLTIIEGGKVVYVNDRMSEITGYSQEELSQMSSLDLAVPEEKERLQQIMVKARESAEPLTEVEYWIMCKDGGRRCIQNRYSVSQRGADVTRYVVTSDITEQKRAQDALRENEERLDLALEAANAGVWEFWPQDDEAFFNDRWFGMLGYEPDELEHSYATWRSLLHPDDLERAEGAVMPAVEAGTDFVVDFRMRTKDGGWRWIHDIGKTVEWTEDGAAKRMLGTHTDITESKLAEIERQRFTTQLSTAADIATQVSTILHPDELLNTVIPLLKERFGLYYVHYYQLDEEAEELVLTAGYGEPGQKMLEQGHRIPLEREVSLVARAARDKEPVVVHDVTQAPDFMPNPLLPDTKTEVAVPVVAAGQVLGVFDVQHDEIDYFTQGDLDVFSTLAGQVATALQNADLFAQTQARLRVSQALAAARTEEEVLDALIEVADFYPNAHRSVFMFDPLAQEPTLIQSRNIVIEGTPKLVPDGTRFPASSFPLMQNVSADQTFVSANALDDERTDEATRQMVESLGVFSVAILPITAGSEWLGVLIALSPEEGYFDEHKLYLYRSLAEQGAQALRTARLYDETQKAAARLEKANVRQSEFLSSMSHELRTPLNSIIGYTEIMLMGIDGELDSETQQDVQAIYENSQYLLRILNDILDLAKIEAGRLSLDWGEIYVDALVDAARSSATGLLASKPEVELIIDLDEDLPTIRGDQVRLSQIINNLVSNAVKFTDEGHVTVRAFSDDGWLCIEVQDSGIGIAEEDMDKIFDKYQQAESSGARRTQGTGLGLPISRQLIQLHGGTIEVQSELGKGSTFTVRLPLDHQEGQALAESEGEAEE